MICVDKDRLAKIITIKMPSRENGCWDCIFLGYKNGYYWCTLFSEEANTFNRLPECKELFKEKNYLKKRQKQRRN